MRFNPFTGEENGHQETDQSMASRRAAMGLLAWEKKAEPRVKILGARKEEVVMIVMEHEGRKVQIPESEFRKHWHQELIEFYRSKFDIVSMTLRQPK